MNAKPLTFLGASNVISQSMFMFLLQFINIGGSINYFLYELVKRKSTKQLYNLKN